MEPNNSTMEEPDSLEVLVKTLDSQTRTFIVGAQVRPQYWTSMNFSSCRPSNLREQPGFLVLNFSSIDFFVHVLDRTFFDAPLLSKKLWFGFALPSSISTELSAEGNVEEGGVCMPSSQQTAAQRVRHGSRLWEGK